MNFAHKTKKILLPIGDIFSFLLGLFFSLLFRYLEIPSWEKIYTHLPLFLTVFFFWVIINYINGLYDLEKIKNKKYRRLLEAGIVSLLVSAGFFYILTQKSITPKTILLLNVILGYSISACWRKIYEKIIKIKKLNNNIIFIGYSKEVLELIHIMKENPEKGYKPLILIDPEINNNYEEISDIEIYHDLEKTRQAISNFKIQTVVVAPHLKKQAEALKELYQLLFSDIEINDLYSFYETITGRIATSTFSEGWFLDHLKNKTLTSYQKISIALDYIAGILIGIIFCLVFPLTSLAVKINSKGPLFIKQKRIGRLGKEFTMYKFRSMYALAPDGSAETDGVVFATKNDKRITTVGKFLRKTRLDELPQFINLLKKDVSLIGPRPERPEIVKQIEKEMPYFSLRHIIRPGLMGWALVNQNYTNTLEEYTQKLQYDLYYIKNKSLILDLSIILKSINMIFRMMGQ